MTTDHTPAYRRQLATIAAHLARETRQRDAALAAGRPRLAAEHADRIRRLEIERLELTEKYATPGR